MRFFRTPFILPLAYPSLVWRIKDTGRKELFLTFDDGPIPGPTEFVLDTLLSFRIHATFFCIGNNIRKHPDVFARVVGDGHAVGNHTYEHDNGWTTSTTAYIDSVRQCREAIGVPIDQPLPLFRPPFGRITRAQIRALNDHRIVMWDVLTSDYDRSLRPAECLAGSLRAVRPGSVIVFHDSLKAEPNMTYTLPRFIEQCLAKGYTFRKIE